MFRRCREECRFPDWIELHNRGSASVDLAGWSLSDNEDPRRFVFPPATMLAANGFSDRLV